jgi:hypothetical protein
MPEDLSYLTRTYAELGQFDDAWRCIGEAMTTVETTKERWCEAEIYRIAGEIALMSPEPDTAKAHAQKSGRKPPPVLRTDGVYYAGKARQC